MTHILRKINGKWHIIQPDGTPIVNGIHRPIAFTYYWGATEFCSFHGIPFRFESATRIIKESE